MDFIKELELFLENTPELYGQKLLIVQAMRNPEVNPEEVKTYFSNWIKAGKQMLCANYGVESVELAAEDLEALVDRNMKQIVTEIKAGEYDDLDSVFNVEEKKTEAAEPEIESQTEVSIEDFDNKDFLAAVLAKEFADPEDDNYAEILEEIKNSIDYNQAYRWRGMADFEADGTEYTVIRSDNQAELIAIDEVKNSLESEPETYAQGDWAQQFYYISDTDKNIIANESADFYIDDLSDQDVVEQYGEDEEKEKFAEDESSVDMDEIRERAKEEYAAEEMEKMQNPLEYAKELGYDLGQKKPDWLQFDETEAAEYVVQIDGWEHVLSRYDGNYEKTPEGLVYFRR